MATLTIRYPDDALKQCMRIRARFAGLGDVVLPVAEREPVRSVPAFDAPAATRTRTRPAVLKKASRKRED